MRSHFTKRERRWHEPKDDATQTEWLALVFAVGFLVVERGQDARAGRQFRHGKVLAQESGYRMRPVKRPNVRTFGIVAGRAGPVKPPATAAQQGEKVSRVLYSYRSAR